MTTQTETTTNGTDFAQICTITHEGHSYTASGAYSVGNRVFAYVKHDLEPFAAGRCIIQTWDGVEIGRGRMTARRNFTSPGSWERQYRRWIDATIDGRKYRGWYCESSGDYCRLKAY